jgi:predicted nucleic acid-binding protein
VHGRTETVAAFHRILREGHVDVLRFGELLKQFLDDCAASGLHWLPLTDAALSRVETAYASLPATIFLRAADALHLACAAEHGFTEIHSNDARLLAAAPHFGIKGVNVIP